MEVNYHSYENLDLFLNWETVCACFLSGEFI